ncbi:HindIII family type II restriction endonuclease [Pseudemcibacter aquimaris]|uniref:HindIII family type II restriction endonuclease n=1 Tax=Pseudemcibacter aquimaris TaxID=2857064 RepID=UPI002011CF46|nr:HindIII family type II restriction endonuclease [Pseudemcibacter aquimaris]MCC3862526.1 HindIII family type II restriction endonuclease [Pseudemcibacter aquimaris]WDU57788.1 HindIII family type II restriction endonuclease [Pseudemcibacter aquimaris]
MDNNLQDFFDLYNDIQFREESFNFLTCIVEEQVEKNGTNNLNADEAIVTLKKKISNWEDIKFAFLLCHSCYIPDHYPETGSEETLFSKLIEYLIYEWGVRLGYTSILQKEKSTKEDVTFFNNNDVIVCDAKSNRLGRSQKSPNVKDVMKTSEYQTWINQYESKNKVGGFATFPSLLEWSKGSEVHTYLTDKSNPIMLLYNEYIAFMLLKKKQNSTLIFDILKKYPSLFPVKITDKKEAKEKYQSMVVQQLKSIDNENQFEQYLAVVKKIQTQFVQFSVMRLENIIRKNMTAAEEKINSLSNNELIEMAKKLEVDKANKEYIRILKNIRKFRL